MLGAAVLLVAVPIASAHSQTIGAASYPFTDSTGVALEDMSSGTTQLVGPNVDDVPSEVTAIGFDFWFVGTRYTQFSASANGLMRLGPTAVGAAFTNDLATSTNLPKIAPYWDDLFVGTNGKVHYRVVGAAPDRKLVVEWQNMQVPRAGPGNAGSATFQCWLFETSGRIEFVYGGGMALNVTNGGASIGFGSAASVFASVTVTGPSVSYSTANNANVAVIAGGTMYSFTPPVPAAPTGLSFAGVGALAMTLHWTDNAVNETGYAVYRSTDSATYAFVSQLPAGSTSSLQSGLSPSTTYYWRVHANSEGGLSGALAGSQATTAPGAIVTTGSGAWGSTAPDAPWPGGLIPTASDRVAIADGHTVTINAAASCYALTVGQGTSGILQFEGTTARTLTVGRDVAVSPGAVFRSALAGAQASHLLSVGGSLLNDGMLDFSTNGDSAGAGLTFTGGAGATLSGAGSATDVRTITVNKGTGPGATLALTPAQFSVRGATSGAPAFVTLTNGTLRIAGSFAMSGPVFSSPSYIIGANAGFWLDNPNFVVTAQGGSPAVSGVLRVSAGTLNVGTAADHSLQLGDGSTAIIEGGAVNVAGRFCVNSSTSRVTYTQTGGAVTAGMVGNSSTALASFDLGVAAASIATMNAGTILLQNRSTALSGPRDYRNRGGIQNVTGGTLQLGNASTPDSSIFYLSGVAPGLHISGIPGYHTAQLLAATTAAGATFIDSTTTLNLAGFRFTQSQGSLVNHGTITGAAAGSELHFLGTTPQTYSGMGQITAPLQGSGVTVDNPAGVTIDAGIPQSIVTRRVNLVRGVLTNSHKVTLGSSGDSAAVQLGAPGLAAPGGSFDTYPVLSPGLASLAVVYLQESTARVTGFEIPASKRVDSLAVNNSNGVTLAQDTLTITRALVLTSGVLHTAAGNLLRLANTVSSPPAGSAQSYVDGPLGIEFIVGGSGIANRTFAIGAAGAFRPLAIENVNTGGASRVFTAEVIPGATGGVPASPLLSLASARYWRVANSATLNAAARVNLTFGLDDNVGTLSELRVAQSATANGSYESRGGTTTGSPSSGTVESTSALTPGSDYFAIGSTGQLATTWDGGAGTIYWGDSLNWSPDGVPGAGTNVSLNLGAPTTIDVNGPFSVGGLTVGENVTIALGMGSLAVGGNYVQTSGTVAVGAGGLAVAGTTTVTGGTVTASADTFAAVGAVTISGGAVILSGAAHFLASGNFTLSAGSISLGSGTLEVRGGFSKTGGTFASETGTTIFSGSTTQAINGAVSYYDLILRNGGNGKPKRFTAGTSFAVNNDFTVDSTAQISVSANDLTDVALYGNFRYSGLGGGARQGQLVLHLRGVGKTIAGVPAEGAQLLAARVTGEVARPLPAPGRVIKARFLTDPSRAVRLGTTAEGKPILRLENTYERKRAEVNELLRTADADAMLVIELDDMTITRNPASYAGLPGAESGGVGISSATSTIEMPLYVEGGGTYSLGGNLSIASVSTLSILSGRLDCGGYTVGGAGDLVVGVLGTLGTATTSPGGLGATVITTGTSTYNDGAIIEYNAAGDQTIHALSHPAAALIHTSGSGTKGLDGDKIITGSSGPFLNQGALLVGTGTAFADSAHRISFTTIQYANVVVNGTYLSTGGGSISYESGAFGSNIVAAGGTAFGDLLINFDDSANSVDLNAAGTANLGFRNLVFGGTAGSGTAGGTLRLSETGTTNVTVTGNVTIAPADVARTGGGFGGTSGKTGLVTLLGNLTSTSTAATQPILDNVGANTLEFGGAARETLSLATNATVFTGSTLQVGSAGLAVLGGITTCTVGPGGTLALGDGVVNLGSRTLVMASGSTVTRTTGRVVGQLKKAIAAGPATATFEIGSETDAFPVNLVFGNVGTPGSVTAFSTAGDHPNLATSGLNTARSVNRYYTLVNEGVGFDSCAVSLAFPPATVDPGANPDSFFVRKYAAPNWSATGVGARTPTSTQGTGISSLSDFAIGNDFRYTLAASAGPGGTIAPSGGLAVLPGSSQSFTITPLVGHHITDVLVDGVSVGAVTGYAFSNVTTHHTIQANFAIDTFPISATAGEHGAISPAGVTSVDYGSSIVYTITADSGYAAQNVVVDGDSVGPVRSYTFSNVTGPHTISASFKVNLAPSLSGVPGSATIVELMAYGFTASATDPDVPAQALAFSLVGAPAGASIDSLTGTFAWTPGEGQGPGLYPFAVRVSDGWASTDSAITLTVEEVNAAPVLAAIGNRVVSEDSLLSFTASATDSDPGPQALRFSLAGAPAGAAIDSVSGAFAWTPAEAQGPGDYPVTVVVTDDGTPALADSESISIHVAEVNAAPVLAAIGNQSGDEGTLLSFTASAVDPDLPAQTLTYTLDAGAPAGASLDDSTGVFTWTPSEGQGPGDYAVTVRVWDDGVPALADSESITIHVDEVNAAPVLAAIGNRTVAEDSLLSFTASATDSDPGPQALAYTLAAGAPAGASIDSSTGAFTWTPGEGQGPGDYAVTVRVWDDGVPALADSESITIHVDEVNTAPALAAIGNQSGNEGALLSFTASATDADLPAQALTYTLAAGAPAGAVIDSTTGVFSWTPSEAQGPGDYPLTVRVTDNGSPALADAETLSVHVDEANAAPVLAAIGNRIVTEDSLLSFTTAATDADLPAQNLKYSLDAGAPAGAAIDSVSGAFAWTPAAAQGPGDYPVTVIVTDDGTPALADSETITIHVNEPPALSGVPATATIPELSAYGFTASATDADQPAQTLTFSLIGAPAGAAIDSTAGAFSWTPGEAQGPGVYPFTVRVTDGVANADAGITLTVDEVNAAPVLAAIGNQSVNEGALLSFTAGATDADLPAQSLSYTLDAGAPAGASIDSSTGAFTWTPAEAQGPGDYPVTVRVTDNGTPALADSETISIHVDEVNAPPALSGVPASATIPELSAYGFTAGATDADVPAQSLTFSMVGAPAGAAIDSITGAFTWTPAEAQGPGSHPFTVRVTDGATNTDAAITLTVEEANTAPALAAIGNQSVNEGTLLSFTASATDADLPAQSLSYTLDAGAPSGAGIDPGTGAFSWTPAEAQGPGDYPVTVRVTDNATPALADSETITIHVDDVNVAPALSDVPASATIPEAVAYGFTANATDADLPAQSLTFSLVGAPAGAAIDSVTGAFTWTPTAAQGPGVYAFTVRVTDGMVNTDAGITLTVSDVNAPPVLAAIGNQSVSEGTLLSFTASATDSDVPAQSLAYSLDAGAPAGAAIDSTTGAFTWTPAEAHGPGDYPVTVRVTDNGAPPLDDFETITIHVDEVNVAPVLSGVAAADTIPELVSYGFTAGATDADLPAQPLRFSLVGAPVGAAIDSITGAFSWTPSEAQGPGVHAFTVRVSDGLANSDAGITLTVEEVDVPAIADLSSARLASGNDSDGTAKITLTWSPTGAGTTVEVYRAGFGSYPEYDDGGGQVAATPSYPPGAPWALTPVTAPGQVDEPATRDFYFYVAFVRGEGENLSAASNRPSGALNYHLGDVSDGATAGQGDNLVNTADVSLLGAHYGLTGSSAVAPYAYLDVGPTTDLSPDALPTTDDALDFEDLMLFTLGYDVVSAHARPAAAGPAAGRAAAADEIRLAAPARVAPGQDVAARLSLLGSGRVQGLSIRLEWDPAVVRPVRVRAAERFQVEGGIVLSPRPGTLDAVLLGVREQALAGEWEIGAMAFEAIAAGDPRIRIAETLARDRANRRVEVSGIGPAPRVIPAVTALARPAPNPFRQSTVFAISLAQAGHVELTIHAVDGRRVRTLLDEAREPGEYRLTWDGRDQHGGAAAPGMYFVRLTAGSRSHTHRIIYVR